MTMTRRLLRYLGVPVLLCGLHGGVWAALPVGSVVMYSDGRVEKLLSREDGKLLWEDDRKRRYLRSENPIMPVLERRDFLSAKGYVQTLRSGDPDSIAVRPSGDRVEFSVVRERVGGTPSIRTWECTRHAAQREKVLGEMRELDAYHCERFVYHRKTWQRQFKESREFSYSRDLGLIVEMHRKTPEKESKWRLSSVVTPDKATYKGLSRKVRKLRGRK